VRTEQTAFGNVARRYEYDFQGRISQMIFVDKEGKESSHAEYSFEEEGELIPKPNSTRSQRFETQFRYEYDPNGNWIEKIAETSRGPIWTMERRTIRYFS